MQTADHARILRGMADEPILCKLCNTKPYRYTCPKCNINYCSISCYKSTSHINCSESFYCSEVQKELKNSTEEKIPKIVSNLSSLNVKDMIDEMDFGEDEDLWNNLTFKEKENFVKFVNDAKNMGSHPVLDPWWCLEEKCGKTSAEYFVPDLIELDEFEEKKPTDEIFDISLMIPLSLLLLQYVFIVRVLGEFSSESIECLYLGENIPGDIDQTAILTEAFSSLETYLIETEIFADYVDNKFCYSNYAFKEMYNDLLIIMNSNLNNFPSIFYCLSDILSCVSLSKASYSTTIYLLISNAFSYLRGSFKLFKTALIPLLNDFLIKHCK